MHSLAIFWDGIKILRDSAHPIYVAEANASRPSSVAQQQINKWISTLLTGMVLSMPMAVCAQAISGQSLIGFLTVIFAVVSALLGLFTVVPLCIFSGSGIIRERTAQTWDLLAVTPIHRGELLLLKALGSLRNFEAVAGALVMRLIIGLLVGPPLVMSVFFQVPTALQALAYAAAVILIAFDHMQEVTLGVVAGMAIAHQTTQRSTALAFALIVGILIRALPMAAIFVLVPQSTILGLINVWLLNLFAESATLITQQAGMLQVLALLVLFALREIAIYVLLHWMMHHAP